MARGTSSTAKTSTWTARTSASSRQRAAGAVEPGQRVEAGAVARRELEQPLPRLDRALAVAQLVVDDAGVALELAGAQRGLGRAGGRRRRRAGVAHRVEALEHAGELAPALRLLVQVGQRRQDLLVGGRGLERLLPALERAAVVARLGGHAGEAAQDLGPLGGAGRRWRRGTRGSARAARVAGLLEHALHAIERVAIAGQELEHAAAREHHAVDVGEARLVHVAEAAQRGQALDALRDRPLAGRGRAACRRRPSRRRAGRRRARAGGAACARARRRRPRARTARRAP